MSGARRLAPELRRFGCVGCNRGVSGSLRVPALRSRVSARNRVECAVARGNFQCFTLKRSLRPGPLCRHRVLPENVSVHDAGSFAAEVWQRRVRVVADAWPCRCSEVPGRLLEWDDWQRPRAGENFDARVASERRGPSQLASALSRRAAHRDCLPRKRPPNNRCCPRH